MAALALAAGITLSIIEHTAAGVFAALVKAFCFTFAGAAALVLCEIDRKLEGLANGPTEPRQQG